MFPIDMHSIAAFILVILLVLSSGHEVNYCGSKMCGYTNAHTLCQFSFGQSPSCIGYIAAPLTSEEKMRILARLNRRRDDGAGGRLQGWPSAGNMLKLRWVDELAREAQMWADQCRLPKTPEEHDACRDLYSTTVGQCVASVVGEAPGLRVESMVDIWFMQNKLYKGNVTMYEPPDPSKPYYGDFAQIMWARTYMVGCGRSRFMVQLRGRYRTVERLVCNFAPQGPSAYRPLWTIGVPAAVCPSRSRPHAFLTSLCDYQNELNQLSDIDNSMTLEEHILLNAVLEMESNKKQNKASLDDIYLTYLALVTMENTVTTSRFNSIQKRDVVLDKIRFENVNLETKHVELSKLDQILNKTIETKPIQTVTTKAAKKLNIIGRPKAYIMEELSDIGDKTEKHHDVTEAMSKRKKEFYDYLMETSEENLTLIAEEIKLDDDFNENDIHEEHSHVTVLTMPILQVTVVGQTNEDKVKPLDKGAKETVQQSNGTHLFNTTAAYNDSLVKDKIDDYLDDPETVSQLAEALDRMEHSTKKPGKIRREIRDEADAQAAQDETSEKSIVPNDITLLPDTEVLTTLNPKEELNMTDDRTPMLNMVLKYMPYLKPYENELIGTRTQNSGSCLRPLMVLNLIVQFV